MPVRIFAAAIGLSLVPVSLAAAQPKAPVYLWYEPEWFEGVQGSFGYWTGAAKATGAWGVAGPGISAEWSQGGESEWNSMGAAADETRAVCGRQIVIPRAGRFRVFVRYVDHRGKTEPFTVRLVQGGKAAVAAELGTQPIVPPNDEYQLYWGFSFGWGSAEAQLAEGPARLDLAIDKPGEAWRQVDAVLITDDLDYTPIGREKPPFAYFASFRVVPPDGATWRGSGKGLSGGTWQRPKLGGRDFALWAAADSDPKWWNAQNVESLPLYDVFFQFSPPHDIREAFHKQFAGQKDVPIMSWPGLLPGFYLGGTPDLSPDTPLRKWLDRTKTPFYILTNYAFGQYNDQNGPATYAALTGSLADQFLGYIHGEAIGTGGVSLPDKPLAPTRRQHVDALVQHFKSQQAARWSAIYKTQVHEAHWAKGIPCLSVDSIALAHLFHEAGSQVVGYEEDATNVHVPMRIAFERGAARQYGGAWINYASGNFGDACNYFTQNPVVNRGAGGWFHSKYAVTDGVTIGWYRKLYYLNYMSGASAIFWEQGLGNQFFLPGPGTHPIQLSPFGRATVDFQEFVDRLPDRGEPVTPVALLVSSGHAYERVNYSCKMLHVFAENDADRELRELFNVCWHPAAIAEGRPAAPDVQSLPNGVYGNIFDVLVDRPERAKALIEYPIVWAAGDVELGGPMAAALEDYVKRGGTLVVNVEAARGKLPEALLGVKFTDQRVVAESWTPEGGVALATTPYETQRVELAGAKALAFAAGGVPLITRNQVGEGAVLLTLVPRMLGRDERAHPAMPFLMNGLTSQLLPVEILSSGGNRPSGQIMHQLNRTKEGYVVTLFNNQGVDKTQNGIARVDRRAFVDVLLRTKLLVRSARELTQPREFAIETRGDVREVRVRVHPGDVQVMQLKL
ncbi:MAG: hypothetical protein HYS13_21925 [Planctomycetia bacterium]|nr:hypothetical protein [Planctomycetia bacterium]